MHNHLIFFRRIAATLLLATLVQAAFSQQLRKRCFHAFSVGPAPDSLLKKQQAGGALLIRSVLPKGTAAAAGLQSGDVLLTVNSHAVSKVADLRAPKFSTLREGDEVVYEILRDGQRIRKTAIASGRPDEAAPGIVYRYHAVPFRGGQLRAIVSEPELPSKGKLPAVYIIQGYTCGEMVDLDTAHPYRRLADGLTRLGYVVMRIEKPGVGDCLNTPACGDIDFDTELAAFETGLQYFRQLKEVDDKQVFLFGHSLGGLIAPWIASRNEWIKGVMVYGTLNRIWGEYLLHMVRVQSEGFGVDPVTIERSMRLARKIIYEVYTLKKSPAQLVKEDPALKEVLTTDFMWEPETDRLFTRSLQFNQALDDFNPNLYWSKTSARVLAIYGEADVEALNPESTISLAKTVNQYHPGNAEYRMLPGTDHSFAKVGTIEDGYRTKADPNYAQIMFSSFNPELTRLLADWMRKVSGNRPVSAKMLWKKLKTEPYPGKQDDICFTDENRGWYVNGGGNIYRTSDGGNTWVKCFNKPGTFFRCIAFLDSLRGFAGTVGTDYFPNVKDTIPLYRTMDGGISWEPVSYQGPYVKGLCAIDVVKEQYINHGQIDYRYHIFAVGRVGSPANIMLSDDGGKSFRSWSMQADCKMLFDIKMFSPREGFVCAATSEDIATSNALVLYTRDGGKTWEKRYQSTRSHETTWKLSFPVRDTGYVTIQNYNPDPAVSQQRIARTTDGGKTWKEIDLCNDHRAREFGIGFVDALHGYVGTMTTGYETKDAGMTWEKTDLGRACNKIRIYKRPDGTTYGYAIGVDVLKLTTE